MSTDLVVQDTELAPTTLYGTSDPEAALAIAAKHAKTFERLVREQNLIVPIGKAEHVRVEAWTALGGMLGVHGVIVWTRPLMDGDVRIGWEARSEARNLAGNVVGAAEAICTRTESLWRNRDEYALKSMAQTRALSKSLRAPLGFILVLAGFNPTPAEEMPVIDQDRGGEPVEDSAAAASSAPVGASRGPSGGEPASLPDNADGTPFGYDIDAPVEPAGARAPVYISEKQRTRLFTIAAKAGVSEDDVREIVRMFTGQESTKQIVVGVEYDGIITAIQAKATA